MKSRQIINKTRDDYNIIASDFSQKRFYMWNEIKPYLKLIKKGDKVLDLGCGNARVFNELKNYNINYSGIDISPNLIAIAKKKYPNIYFKTADILDSRTWDNLASFDVVISLAVLHHLPTSKDHNFVLSKIFECLKPNGIFILSVWNLWQKKFWKMHFKQLGFKIRQGFKFKWLEVPYHVSDAKKTIKTVNRFFYGFATGELKQLIKNSGLTLTDIKCSKNLCLTAQKLL